MPLLPRHRVEAVAFRARSAGRFAVHPLRVAAVERLADDAVAIALDVPDELREAYRHRPGQHVVVLHAHGDEVVRRSYSICSPATGGELRIGVRRIPGGVFSSLATERLCPGDVLHVMVPTGSFSASLGAPGRRHYGAVVAGSGITPILSIAATALELEPAARVTLLYGNRTRASTMFRRELEQLSRRHPGRLSVTHVLSREQAVEPPAVAGRITPALLDEAFAGQEVDEWFLCGPEELMDETVRALADRGVPDERVHRELFFTSAEAVVDDDRPDLVSEVRLRLNGAETALALGSRADPILVAALPLRDDLPYSCRDGICATCRAKVVEGKVAMDRCSALDRRELDAGYVLACQAHPVTPAVVLDFDA